MKWENSDFFFPSMSVIYSPPGLKNGITFLSLDSQVTKNPDFSESLRVTINFVKHERFMTMTQF